VRAATRQSRTTAAIDGVVGDRLPPRTRRQTL
jgi:hypothetical protein